MVQQYKNIETGKFPTIIQNPEDVIISPQGYLQGQLIRVDEDGEITYMTREAFSKLYVLEEVVEKAKPQEESPINNDKENV